MKTSNVILVAAFCVVLAVSLFAVDVEAGVRVSFAYTTGPADIRVWLDRGYDTYDDYDVYPDVDDVVLRVQASRSCYATVYVVDTEGFIHVIHPMSASDNAFIRGGRVYEFYLADYGFGYFDRGIAYAFAVSSPVPFHYDDYALGVFGCGYGFRIHGDPYIASKRFYVRLVGGRCEPFLIGVSHARFYIREYVRYPRYLCVGWHDHHGARRYCRGDCSAYRHYRLHSSDPYRVIHPRVRIKHELQRYTEIARHEGTRPDLRRNKVRSRDDVRAGTVKTRSGVQTNRKTVKSVVRDTPTRRTHVVRSSKDTYVKSKSRITKMRRELERVNRSKPRSVSRVVTPRAVEKRGKSAARVQKAPDRDRRSTKASVKRSAGKDAGHKNKKAVVRKTTKKRTNVSGTGRK